MISRDIEMLQYKCILTPLTPIQIGNGNDISPFEYVIKNGEYYRIDINEVMEKVPENIKKQFLKVLEENSMFTARKFLKNNYRKEYGYIYKCPVSPDYVDIYERKIAGVSNKNENNELAVSEFIGTNTEKYIPGSTLKGAFRSAYLFENFTSDNFYEIKREEFNRNGKKNPTKPFKSLGKKEILLKKIESQILELENFNAQFDPFKNLKITDTETRNNVIEVKQILRKGMKKEGKKEIPMGNFEVTKSLFSSNENIEFGFQIIIKNLTGNKNELLKRLSIKQDKKTREYIQQIRETVEFYLEDGGILEFLNNKADKIIKEDIKFFEKIKDKKSLEFCYELQNYKEKLNENQAMIRIGRGAGFNSTTFNLCNKKIEEVFTRVTVDDIPIGWALITCNEI